MNKHSTTYYLSFFAATTTFYSFYAMEQQLQLSNVEQQLLIREIDKRGKDPLLKEINKKREIKFIYDQEQRKNGILRPIILVINDTFYKSATDPLSKNIFDAIETHEKEHRRSQFNHRSPSSKLGNRTRYYWLENDNNAAVTIQARFKYIGYDQRALTAFVENYSQ